MQVHQIHCVTKLIFTMPRLSISTALFVISPTISIAAPNLTISFKASAYEWSHFDKSRYPDRRGKYPLAFIQVRSTTTRVSPIR